MTSAVGYDFVRAWPLPRDAEMRRAGRQGILDQKESADMTNQQWLAVQHDAYAIDWRLHMFALAEIAAHRRAVQHGIGRFRSPQARAAALAALRESASAQAACLRAFLDDYGCHYGSAARAAFVRFLVVAWREARQRPANIDERGQRLLF